MNETKEARGDLLMGMMLLVAFALWTGLIQSVDVRPVGLAGTDVGFATLNTWFHRVTGVHMGIYTLTDWLGLIPMIVCLCFGGLGAIQLVRRRSLLRVDADLLVLGVYYVVVVLAYFLFEALPINYRPVLIEGVMEASYPSSTTLLVLSVMPTLSFQVRRRAADSFAKRATSAFVAAFSTLMVLGRLVSGVHWLTDIVGSVLLASGLYVLYRFVVVAFDGKGMGVYVEG